MDNDVKKAADDWICTQTVDTYWEGHDHYLNVDPLLEKAFLAGAAWQTEQLKSVISELADEVNRAYERGYAKGVAEQRERDAGLADERGNYYNSVKVCKSVELLTQLAGTCWGLASLIRATTGADNCDKSRQDCDIVDSSDGTVNQGKKP